jgi:hypothetical protein
VTLTPRCCGASPQISNVAVVLLDLTSCRQWLLPTVSTETRSKHAAQNALFLQSATSLERAVRQFNATEMSKQLRLSRLSATLNVNGQ